MSRQGNPVSGILTALMEKSEKKQLAKQKVQIKPSKSQQSDSDQSENKEQEKQIVYQQKHNSESENKRGRHEQQIKQNIHTKQHQNTDQALKQFKKLINQMLKHLKTPQKASTRSSVKQKQRIWSDLFQKLMSLRKETIKNISFDSISYLSQKYSLVLSLAKQSNIKNSKYFSEGKLANPYVCQQDLRELCFERHIDYQKRRLPTQLTLLTYDLLLFWYKKTYLSSISYINQNQTYPYPFLLEAYKNQNLEKRQPLIDELIKTLQNICQETVVKIQQNQKHTPQLSLKFIISLIYVTCLVKQKCWTLLQIFNNVWKQLQKYFEEIANNNSQEKQRKQILILMLKERNLKIKRIKKICNHFIKYMQNSIGQKSLSIANWCAKYSKMFQLPDENFKQLKILVETLTQGYIESLQNNCKLIIVNNLYPTKHNNSKRYLIVDQPEIVLSCLTIYLKLKFGLDKGQYPYLKCIGQVWELIKQMQGDIKESHLERFTFLKSLIKQNKCFNINAEGKSTFGLNSLLQSVIKSNKDICKLQDIKDLSFKSVQDISKKVHSFKSMFQGNSQKTLNLIYNLRNNQINNESFSFQNSKQIQIKYVEKRQPQQISQVFRNKQLKKTISLEIGLIKQIDWLYQKKKQHMKQLSSSSPNVIEKINQKSESNNTKKGQFPTAEHLDNPSQHYEIIYQPTLNTLSQMQMKQFTIFVQNLSYSLNGQYSDCADILEWIGLLQGVIVKFQQL